MKRIYFLMGLLWCGAAFGQLWPPGNGTNGSGTNIQTSINLTGTNGLTFFIGTNVDDSSKNTIELVDKGGGTNIQINTANVVTNGFLIGTSGGLTVNGGTNATIINNGSLVLNSTAITNVNSFGGSTSTSLVARVTNDIASIKGLLFSNGTIADSGGLYLI